tara:strand:+ start:3009 stop:3572 length:564 start_codon:yes stop_codon:yes gene_type:complete
MYVHALYRKYFQKSKIFLYPLLDIKRGTKIVPSETYLGWNESYTPEDMKLICVYNTTNSDYEQFEKTVLLKHTRISDYIKVNDKKCIIVFDFSDLKEDWFHFVNGKYSQINVNLKRKIIGFFDESTGNYIYVYSYLFPEKFFARYAEILDVPVDLLKSVGELCDKPDLNKEKLVIVVANLQNSNILE